MRCQRKVPSICIATKTFRLQKQDFHYAKWCARELASFWRENAIAGVILLRFLALMS